MLHVVTVNAGDYQGRGVEYTNILFDSVRRNLPEGFEGEFVVFTDQPDGYEPGIIVRPLTAPHLTGWWHKLSLFQPGIFPAGDRILYFDLSCVITGRLDPLANYQGPLALLSDFFYPSGLQSSVMAWDAGAYDHIWTSYAEAGFPQFDPGGDQVWIERQYRDIAVRLQRQFPDFFASYKCLTGIPARASVVVFHGHPKPHECDGWVPSVWKVGGLCRAELDAVCNTVNDAVLANVRHAMTLPHPWFDFDWSLHDRQVCIAGGSPSLKQSLDALRWRKAQGHEVWATNGAFDYLRSQGIMPNVHVLLDARPENARFVQSPLRGVQYYVASQCDPAVFEALKECEVTIFHCNTDGVAELLADERKRPVHLLGGYTTVGLKAAHLAELLGAQTIHLYGMDSCYLDEAHHAFPQPMNDGERRLAVVYGGWTFSAAPWMVGQAEDFIVFVQRFAGLVTVDGPGLLAYIARTGIPESAAETRAREILSRLPGGTVQVAEIGVFAGDTSRRLLQRRDLTLLMVDSWRGAGESYVGDSGDWHATLTQQQQDEFYKKTVEAVKFAGERAQIHRCTSQGAAALAPPGYFDCVFIDADHSYEGAKADIESWAPKVKPGGWLAGHDYENTDFPKFGVTQAVQEWAQREGLSVELGDNFTWFIRIPEGEYERFNQFRDGAQVDCAVGSVRA